MTRDEAIKQRILSELEKEDIMSDPRNNTMNFTSGIRLAKKIVSEIKVDQPPTLAEFLGWEEGVEYEYYDYIYKIESEILYQRSYDKQDWEVSDLEVNLLYQLRQAKKIEPKPKAYRVKDEYSLECLVQELQDQGFEYKTLTLKDHMKIKKDFLKHDGVTYLYADEVTGIDGFNENFTSIDEFEIVDYHKEEPKYYAKIKGGKFLEPNHQYFRWHKKLEKITIGNNIRCAGNKDILDHYMTKSEWEELGINDTNADFEEIEGN